MVAAFHGDAASGYLSYANYLDLRDRTTAAIRLPKLGCAVDSGCKKNS